MKILHINTQDSGGAGKACIRIIESFNQINLPSKLLVLRKKTNFPFIFKYNIGIMEQICNIFYRMIHKIELLYKKNKEVFSFPNTGFNISNNKIYKESEIIHLHWVAFFLDYKLFFKKNNKKIFWTLHDMAPFYNGNHYTVEENSSSIEDKILADKIKIFEKNNIDLTIVSPSKWLLQLSQKSALFSRFPHYHIPNPVDSNIYKNFNLKIIREEFKIPLDKKVILFVSENLENKRKGFNYLKEAIEILKSKEENIYLCIVGSDSSNLVLNEKEIYNFGYIKSDEQMSKIYSCADLFVIPSIEDNLPNTMIESLMCGTPVVGFNVGGISETIINNINGYLCAEISSKNLAGTILLASKTDFDKKKIRAMAIEKYDSKVIAKKYLDLYKKDI